MVTVFRLVQPLNWLPLIVLFWIFTLVKPVQKEYLQLIVYQFVSLKTVEK